MSCYTWINYGYGINVDDLVITEDVEKINKFLDYAPKYKKEVFEKFADCDITEPIRDDYEELDEDYHLGFASLIKEVLCEYSDISFVACEDEGGDKYVMFCEAYPWNMSEKEKSLTTEMLDEIMSIVSLIVENPESLSFAQHECENWG